MAEAELASELAIIVMSGLQDRKKIDGYYKRFDEVFKQRKYVLNKFRRVVDTIAEIMQDDLPESNFSKKPLFYSLFGVIHELCLQRKIHKRDYPKILSALHNLDNILNSEPDDLSSTDVKFYNASVAHVTDLSARTTRHDFIRKAILKSLKRR